MNGLSRNIDLRWRYPLCEEYYYKGTLDAKDGSWLHCSYLGRGRKVPEGTKDAIYFTSGTCF
eukprot:scaffold12_cov368-Pavlova_lutheri.AAC.9